MLTALDLVSTALYSKVISTKSGAHYVKGGAHLEFPQIQE